MINKLWQLLLMTLPILLLAACSGNTPTPEEPPPDLDIQIIESPEPKELNPSDLLSVHFINVGEGDAILIVQGEYAMLVDGGPTSMGATVFTYLRNQGISQLEYVVATHPFTDHVGGLPDILRRISVNNVLMPMIYHDTPAYNAFLSAVEDSNAYVAVPFVVCAWQCLCNSSIAKPNRRMGKSSELLHCNACGIWQYQPYATR